MIDHIPPKLAYDYKFERKIGEGANGETWLARQRFTNRLVAVKCLRLDKIDDIKTLELFERESELLKSIHVDGVPTFYDYYAPTEKGSGFLVQEYVQAPSIQSLLDQHESFTEQQIIDIAEKVAGILYHLETEYQPPIIHRDIKPSNILYRPADGVVYLIDFGAVANPQVQSGGSTVAGTYGYMPPEQLMGRPQPASDIYSLAAVAVEMFSGKSPATMPTKDFRLIFEPEVESQPPVLVATLRQMLEPDVKNRLCDIEQLRKRFANYKNGVFRNADVRTKKDKAYQNQLLAVNSIGEPGNIDLWQKLPDTILRDVPDIFDIDPDEIIQLPLRKDGQTDPAVVSRFSTLSVIVFLVIFIIFAAGLSPLIALGVFAAYFMIAMHVVPSMNEIQYLERQSAHEDDDKLRVERRRLLMDGRKTIATIVSIEYVPQNDEDCIYLAKMDTFGTDGDPKFRIQYKFNPPDDARKTDLVHSCIVHEDPHIYCKPGDPLPILYLIQSMGKTEKVYSMPYPYPIERAMAAEIVDVSSVVGA